MNPNRKKYALYLIFVLSGVGGLIYESIWSHYLKLFLGHAAYAQSLVLIIFMGGMGVGAWLSAAYSVRWKNLLLGYALVELIIGVTALFFHAAFTGFTAFAYDQVLPGLTSPVAAEAFRWSGSALMILPQSILLGMTFPLLSGGLVRLYPDTSGSVLSSLYFTNSIGAAIGVLLSGFVLIEAVGLPGTILVAGIINIAVAIAVWSVAKSMPDASPMSAVIVPASTAGAGSAQFPLLLVAFLTGAASFVYEIVWIRMLSMVLGSSTHAFEIMLSAFILGLAFGSLFIRRYINTIANPRFVLAIIQVVMGLLAVGSLVLYNTSFDAMRIVMQGLARTQEGYGALNLASMAITMAIMFPAAFCAGMTLPLITHVLIKSGHGEKSIGGVYATNTFGSIAGVILAVHVALPLLGIKGALMLGAGIDIVAGMILLSMYREQQTSRIGPLPVLVASIFCLTLTYFFVHPDTIKMASGIYRFGRFVSPQNAEVLFSKDGKTTTVHLLSEFKILTLRTNGKTDASLQLGDGPPTADEYTQTLTGVLGSYHSPKAEYVANIGIGSGMTTHAVLSNPNIKEVHTIEIERYMVEGAKYFGKPVERTFTDPRSKIFIDDAKSFLAVTPRKYDMIISEPSNPWVSGVSSLFTREFYGRMKSKLQPNGIFLQWLQIYQIDYDVVASVIKALGAEFGDYVIYETMGGDIAILASPTKMPEPTAELFSYPNAVSMLERFKVRTPGDLEIRRIGDKQLLHPFFSSFTTAQNSDFFPILDLRAVKDRYLEKTAIQLSELNAYAIPVTDMLQRRATTSATLPASPKGITSPRLRDAVVARQMADFALTGANGTQATLNAQFVAELEHVRNHWLRCTPQTAGAARLDPVLRLAQFVNPGLAPSQLEKFWATFTDSPCNASLSQHNREWLRLFAAVGQRDAARMADLSRTLLPIQRKAAAQTVTDDGNSYPAEIEYLHVAAVVGLVSQGRAVEAREVWREVLAEKSVRFKKTVLAQVIDAYLAQLEKK